MATMVLDPAPAGFEAFLERRHALGQDRHDEVWQGVYQILPEARLRHQVIEQRLAVLLGPLARARGLHATTAFNLGETDDYRVPDGGLHRALPDLVRVSSAALVVEIVSPGDRTWEKLAFYAEHHVDELVIVDPGKRTVDWLALTQGEYRPVERSALIDLGAAELIEQIEWHTRD
jgi:Uma2 family endonuclease